MTRQQQAFDISDNNVFKDTLRKNCETWFLIENFPMIQAIKNMKTSVSKLAEGMSFGLAENLRISVAYFKKMPQHQSSEY